MKKYIINLESNFDILEKYEEKEDNVMSIKVFDENNNEVTNLKQVILYLSKNALLGLGTELIRFSESYREGRHFHLEAAEKKEDIVQTLGVFLTPDSTNMIVVCADSKAIDDYYDKEEKSK